MNLERYICPPLAEHQQCIHMPFLCDLCAFAPLRETRKFGSDGNFTGSFSQRRKGAKIAKQIPKAGGFFRRRMMTENEIAKHIVDAALKVHKRFGPGLL
jgi:hypothetical protein